LESPLVASAPLCHDHSWHLGRDVRILIEQFRTWNVTRRKGLNESC
jgi:hypothetical protein